MEEEREGCNCEPGLPAWMATFSDLMSLLMCFFVLLLAFSEMDVLKFKQIAGSMKSAFGVQNQIEIKDIPKGTSVIALEFQPGRPVPTPIDELAQQTMDTTKSTLEFQAGQDASVGWESQSDAASKKQNSSGLSTNKLSKSEANSNSGTSASQSAEEESTATQIEEAQGQTNQKETSSAAKRVSEQLEEHVVDGAIEVESLGQQLIIRIKEKGAFAAGSAFLQPKLAPIVRDIAEVLNAVPGEITITGHSDNVQINTELYKSNWELSSQRAIAVVYEMEKVPFFDSSRVKVVGMGSNQPLEPNTSEENRQRNRRVEISVLQGKPFESEELPAQLID